jgi:catechol-2,3-dioxygenase
VQWGGTPTRRSGAVLFLARSEADRLLSVPSISGRVEVNLTVRDPASSATWYSELLGLEELYDFTGEDGRMRYIALIEPRSQFVLCLVGHQEHSRERFSEFRTGLDHLEFLVDRREDLNEWAEKLNRLGVSHSGVKQPEYTSNAMLTFRDPDNIQLEFFWRAPTV